MKKGIIINFPQTTKDGPGEEVEFEVVELWEGKTGRSKKSIFLRKINEDSLRI